MVSLLLLASRQTTGKGAASSSSSPLSWHQVGWTIRRPLHPIHPMACPHDMGSGPGRQASKEVEGGVLLMPSRPVRCRVCIC